MTTIHAMSKSSGSKKLVAVNGFKASEEWYATVLQVAEERGSTIGGAIQHLVELALPIYMAMHEAEQAIKAQRTAEIVRGLKKRAG